MAIIRVYAGSDGQSHFEEIHPKLESRRDQSASGELIPGSGIVIRRFEPTRSNPWHHAPGRYAVFTLSGAVDIEIGDGTVKRLGPGDILSLGVPAHKPIDVHVGQTLKFKGRLSVDGDRVGLLVESHATAGTAVEV